MEEKKRQGPEDERKIRRGEIREEGDEGEPGLG